MTTHLGHFLGMTRAISKTPTITAGAYSASDVVGGLMLFDFTFGGRTESGVIRRLAIYDGANDKAALDVYLYRQRPVNVIADNGAFALTNDNSLLITKIAVAAGDYTTVGSVAYAFKDGLNIDYHLTGAPKEGLFAYAVCTGTPTYDSTTQLIFRLTCWVD